MKLIFATNNDHKAAEIRSVIRQDLEIITLKEAGIDQDIPEPYNTLEENARTKSATVYAQTGTACFSEDTGLEVDALGGEPGVKSARYAGENRSFDDNITKLLEKLKDKPDRKARFRTVISLIWEGKEYQFEGVCEGRILEERRGGKGFGYDPVFVPEGSGLSFAEMDMEGKNRFSHRKKATEKLVAFLNSLD